MWIINHRTVDNGDVEDHSLVFQVEFNSESVPDPYTTSIQSIDDDEMDHLLEFFYSEHDEDLLDVDLHMLQAWLVLAPPSKIYTFSTVLFNKYRGTNVVVANCMSRFSMFVPTKATVKLSYGNKRHEQEIGVILCRFPNCSIIYLVGLIYYCPGHPSSTISSGALKLYVGF